MADLPLVARVLAHLRDHERVPGCPLTVKDLANIAGREWRAVAWALKHLEDEGLAHPVSWAGSEPLRKYQEDARWRATVEGKQHALAERAGQRALFEVPADA